LDGFILFLPLSVSISLGLLIFISLRAHLLAYHS